MNKYFVTKSLVGFMVISEEFDELNGGSYYASASIEYETEEEAQECADRLNNEIFLSTCCNKEVNIEEAILNHGMCSECMDKASE